MLFCLGKHFSDTFPIQNGLKQWDALLPWLFFLHQGSAAFLLLRVTLAIHIFVEGCRKKCCGQ
jgi:hypothetical protein